MRSPWVSLLRGVPRVCIKSYKNMLPSTNRRLVCAPLLLVLVSSVRVTSRSSPIRDGDYALIGAAVLIVTGNIVGVDFVINIVI